MSNSTVVPQSPLQGLLILLPAVTNNFQKYIARSDISTADQQQATAALADIEGFLLKYQPPKSA